MKTRASAEPSGIRPGSDGGGSARTAAESAAAIATAASGAWTAKIARQSKSSVRIPPSAGPTAVPSVPAVTQIAIARRRSPLRTTSTGSEAPSRSAAPIPCATRPATSASRLFDRAHPIDATRKTPSPASRSEAGRTRRTKGRSAKAATTTARLYAVTTQEISGIVVWSSRNSSGRARTTIEESANATATETARAISRARRGVREAGSGTMAAAYAVAA